MNDRIEFLVTMFISVEAHTGSSENQDETMDHILNNIAIAGDKTSQAQIVAVYGRTPLNYTGHDENFLTAMASAGLSHTKGLKKIFLEDKSYIRRKNLCKVFPFFKRLWLSLNEI